MLHAKQNVDVKWKPPIRGFHYPITALIEVTRCCFSKCKGCGNANLNQGENISLYDFDRILGKLTPYIKEVRLIGGEPTLHPDLLEISRRLDSARIDFSITTNGIYSHWDFLMEALLKLRTFKGFLISLHGHNANVHENFTGLSNSFTNITDAIKSASDKGIWVSTSTVLTKWNVNHVMDIVHLSNTLGAKYAVFNRFLGPFIDGRPDDSSVRNALQEISTLAEEGMSVRFGNCVPSCVLEANNNTVEICPAGRVSFAIGPDGSVRPCLHTNIGIGNLLVQDLETIWKSYELEEWRNFIPPSCKLCNYNILCEAGCKLVNSWSPGIDPFISENDIVMNSDPNSGVKIRINAMRVPILLGDINKNGPDWIVYHSGQSVKVNDVDMIVISELNNGLRIQDLERKFGQSAVELVVELWRRGMIEWK